MELSFLRFFRTLNSSDENTNGGAGSLRYPDKVMFFKRVLTKVLSILEFGAIGSSDGKVHQTR